MSNDNGSIWITYNGEVYNFMEVRRELEEIGYKFNSSSDTEVLLKSYEEWGIGCVHRFIGMVALALRDSDIYLSFKCGMKSGFDKNLYL